MSQIRTNSIVPANGLAGDGGGIIQVKNITFNSTYSTTSTSPTGVTGFSIAITPQSTSSKILIVCCVAAQYNGGGSSTLMYRNGSLISGAVSTQNGASQGRHSFAGNFSATVSGSQYTSGHTMTYLDNPGSTSSQTYQVYVACQPGTTYRVNFGSADANQNTRGRGCSFMTLMEVSG